MTGKKQEVSKELTLAEDTVEVGQDIQTLPITPMQMISAAVESGKDLAYIEKLMDMERRWKADQAREAYYEALAEFKKVPVQVIKDKQNKQYDSRYASIGNIVNTVNAAMAPFGLNARWDIDQTEGIKVTCILSHTLGHSESVPMTGPPDESGKKNPLQQIKSTITYLKVSTFEAVTGVVSVDAPDDDGNGSGDVISEEQIADLEALITEVGSDKAAFLRYCKVGDLDEILSRKYRIAVQVLEAKRKA